MIHHAPLIAVAFVALALTGFRGADDGPVLSPDDMIGYLTQARCPDGRPPTECADAVPQRAEDEAHWRKHDYGFPPAGYQAQDAALSTDGSYIVNTWSFDPPNRFNPVLGDGGEIYRFEAGKAKALATQDGGTVAATGTSQMQYFCGGTGWLLFDNRPPTGSWKSEVVWLNISTDQVSCPSPLNPSYTRWRMEFLTIPFNILGKKHYIAMNCIIHEHYNGSTIANAVDMEQAIWCKDWGRIWAAAYKPGGAGWEQFGYRLPAIPWGGGVVPERPDFKLVDARLSTNIQPNPVRQLEGAAKWSAAATGPKTRQVDFGWPPSDYRP